jgi:hypothetical protein
MNANVTSTTAHKCAGASVAKASSPTAAYYVLSAQGLVSFTLMEAGQSKVSMRATNQTRG